MILFVDDMEERWITFSQTHGNGAILWAKTPSEALKVLWLYKNEIKQVWLDHDCGFYTRDLQGGVCCLVDEDFRSVAYALAFMKFPGKVFVHSLSSGGNIDWLVNLLREAEVDVTDKRGQWGD